MEKLKKKLQLTTVVMNSNSSRLMKYVISCASCVSLCVSTGLMLGSVLLFSLCLGAAATLDSKLDIQWDLWKKTHEKTYQNEVCDKNKWM